MKKKLLKIMGIGLAFTLVFSLMAIGSPVSAADYKENDWKEWGKPSLKKDTDFGPIAVAPDGTLYAAIYFEATAAPTERWKVAKSDDNGYTWSDTEWDDMDHDDIGEVVSLVVSPNYADDELVYVGCWGGDEATAPPTVYRLEEAGEGDVIALKSFPNEEDVDELFCIDVWTDEDDYNWIAAATEEDVYVLKDRLFEDWRIQELDTWTAAGDTFVAAYEVAFAPDFEDSNLLYAILEDDDGDGWVVCTVSPGQWGQEVGDAELNADVTDYMDMDFPDDYDSDDNVIIYAGVSGTADERGVWLIEGVDADDGLSNAINLFDLSGDVATTVDIVSIAVSGDYGDETILAGEMDNSDIWISTDGGMNWDDVTKPPTGEAWTHVIMDADVVWGGSVFDTDEGMVFASTWGAESALSRSDDGGEVYNQVGYIDTCVDLILDLGLHPEFPSTPTYLLATFNMDNATTSLWITDNGDDDEPDYERVLCGDTSGADIGNFTGWFGLVTYSWDAEAIFITGTDDFGDPQTGALDSVIWKSTNDGQTFGTKRSVEDNAYIRDWEIPDDRTIYAACWDFDNPSDNGSGFYMTTNSGLSWTSDETGTSFNDIAMSPDFEDGEGFILLGGYDNGMLMLSDNDGDTFEDAEDEEQSGLHAAGTVYVAFDADFADEDADGYMYIYAADDEGSDVQEGKVADTDDVDFDELEDDDGDGDPQEVYCTGLVVAEDNALYAISAGGGAVAGDSEADGTLEMTDGTNTGIFAIPDSDITGISGDFEDGESLTIWDSDLTTNGTGTAITGTITVEGDDSGATGEFSVNEIVAGWLATTAVTVTNDALMAEVTSAVAAEDTGVWRLLLNESNNLWESEGDGNLEDPFHLWITPGSNVLWTIDMDFYGDDPEIWTLEDTCSGKPTLSSPSSGYQSDREDQIRISWNDVRDADEYEFKYTNVDPDYTITDQTDETSILLLDLGHSSEYKWKVRVAPDEPWHSRWSDSWVFFTALGEPPWAPTLYTPGGVWQYSGVEVELMPAFSWESANTADSYQFVLADNAEFTSPLVNEKVPESAYQLDFELEYNSNYFWKVQAYKGTEAISRWSDVGAFTTIEKAVPPPSQPPPATVTQPAPAPIVLPTPIPPILLWVIIGIGALLIIVVIILIVRTRRAA
jgi:hypothetical protein